MEPGCIFCQIGAGRAPGSFAYEDERVFAIISLEQPTPYKVLVIPRDHVATVYDLTDEQAAAILRATVWVAKAVRAASGCAGLNLVQANDPVGQQTVPHFHIHVVPRFEGDGIVLQWDNAVADRAELDRLAAEIRARLR